MSPSGTGTAARSEADALLSEARDLLGQLEQEGHLTAVQAASRLADVEQDVLSHHTYRHTGAELTAGARIAWRNNPLCVGKFYWRALEVRDCRDLVDDPGDTPGQDREAAVFEALVEHLRLSWNGGKVRLLLSVFPPDLPGLPAARVWNSQLIRYAGYRRGDGTVAGDPDSVRFTDAVLRLDWRGKGGEFDVLPLVVQLPGREPRWFDLPSDAVPEVRITHPDFPRFEELGLRWHAFPTISNQRLDLGGLRYPLVPFSAWYTCAEIGGRNLSDVNRYNRLPQVAGAMGLDTHRDRTLWRDRALVELVAAVLHSFDRDGVSIIDHHFATKQFVRHEEREAKQGRACPADWSSIVPATSGSTPPAWQRRYEPTRALPNFSPHPAWWQAEGRD
nr:nitric oxide synthase oxygenase [Streptacidiphilus fuscans]